jgi:putative Holliday junction resolvase
MSDSSNGPAEFGAPEPGAPDGSSTAASRDPHAAPLTVPRRGRLLGLDYGTVRVGLAVTEEEQRVAVPLETYTRRNREQDARHLAAVIRDHRIVGLVIGLPLHMGGEEGQKAGEARRFGAWAGDVAGLPITFWDERLSTSQADEHLAAANLKPKKRKLLRDKIAAQIMLQSYLDSQQHSSR